MGERVPATPNLSEFARAAQAAATHIAEAMVPALSRLHVAINTMTLAYAESVTRAMRLSLWYRRATIGGNGADARDPLWQSAVCSAWLHDSCPDVDGWLQCTCNCHN